MSCRCHGYEVSSRSRVSPESKALFKASNTRQIWTQPQCSFPVVSRFLFSERNPRRYCSAGVADKTPEHDECARWRVVPSAVVGNHVDDPYLPRGKPHTRLSSTPKRLAADTFPSFPSLVTVATKSCLFSVWWTQAKHPWAIAKIRIQRLSEAGSNVKAVMRDDIQ